MGATVAAEIISEKGFVCMKKFSIRNSHAGKALGAKGVYITLAACLLALGGAGIAAYNKAMEDITDNLTISSFLKATCPPPTTRHGIFSIFAKKGKYGIVILRILLLLL